MSLPVRNGSVMPSKKSAILIRKNLVSNPPPLYRLGFLFASDWCQAWPRFGCLGPQLSHLSTALHLGVTETVGAALAYLRLVGGKMHGEARTRLPRTGDFVALLSAWNSPPKRTTKKEIALAVGADLRSEQKGKKGIGKGRNAIVRPAIAVTIIPNAKSPIDAMTQTGAIHEGAIRRAAVVLGEIIDGGNTDHPRITGAIKITKLREVFAFLPLNPYKASPKNPSSHHTRGYQNKTPYLGVKEENLHDQDSIHQQRVEWRRLVLFHLKSLKVKPHTVTVDNMT